MLYDQIVVSVSFKHCRREGAVGGLNLRSPISHYCEMPLVEREPSRFLQNRSPTPSSCLRFLNTFILFRILIVPISPIRSPLNAIRRFRFTRSGGDTWEAPQPGSIRSARSWIYQDEQRKQHMELQHSTGFSWLLVTDLKHSTIIRIIFPWQCW